MGGQSRLDIELFVFVAEPLLKVGRYCELCANIQLTVMRLKTVSGKLRPPGSVTYWQRHVHSLHRLTVSMAIAKEKCRNATVVSCLS